MIFDMHTRRPQQNRQNGFTLLIAILVIGIILAIGLSILNITLKEYILSNVARESAIALNAADAGMECALYWDRSSQGNKFDVVGETTAPPAGTPFECMGQTRTTPGAGSTQAQNAQFGWGTPAVCARVTVTKYFNASNPVPMGVNAAGNSISCPMGVECTRTVSLGYNKACPTGFTDPFTDPRTVERGLRALY